MERGFRRVELRHRAEEMGIPLPRFFPARPEDLPLRLRQAPSRYFFIEDLDEAKRRLALNLLLINAAIFGVSALSGYFLADKTLRPIENALEEQKRFVADASHELRTPLTALKTSMEVALKDKKMSLEEAKTLLKSNLEDVDSLQFLSNNLLGLAHYQENGRSLTFQEIDFAEIINKTSKQTLPLARKKEIEIELEVENCFIEGGKESLEQMMLVFLDNAVKYTSNKGKVTIKTKSDGKYLFIEVKDTGIGITKEDIPHIFDRFYRVDQSRSKSKAAGFGLGLSLAKKIIEIHKGTVEISSILGKGTTFTIKLPLKHS